MGASYIILSQSRRRRRGYGSYPPSSDDGTAGVLIFLLIISVIFVGIITFVVSTPTLINPGEYSWTVCIDSNPCTTWQLEYENIRSSPINEGVNRIKYQDETYDLSRYEEPNTIFIQTTD